jgi:hypothetical protein
MTYVVEITEAAADASAVVAEYRAAVGERVRFESRADAEAVVEKFNAEGAVPVHLWSVHEDHPLSEGQSPVDGYVEVSRDDG